MHFPTTLTLHEGGGGGTNQAIIGVSSPPTYPARAKRLMACVDLWDATACPQTRRQAVVTGPSVAARGFWHPAGGGESAARRSAIRDSLQTLEQSNANSISCSAFRMTASRRIERTISSYTCTTRTKSCGFPSWIMTDPRRAVSGLPCPHWVFRQFSN